MQYSQNFTSHPFEHLYIMLLFLEFSLFLCADKQSECKSHKF